MSLNMLQFLKQGVSAKRDDRKHIQEVETKIEPTPHLPNQDYIQCGRFHH